MNTSKQVNVILGLLLVGAIATLLYYLWDRVEREHDATARQLAENAERGGALFGLNCSSCHGLTGKGALERGGLPGAPLNLEDYRPTENKDLTPLRDRFRDTIACGRVGTVMPAWSERNGGSLNDFQIQQLVALITGTMYGFEAEDNVDPNAVSEEAWKHALEEANHAAIFDPPKALAAAVDADETAFVLNEPLGLSPGDVIRIEDDPEDDVYELVEIVDAPASSILSAAISEDETDIPVALGYVFEVGDILTIEKEKVEVTAAPVSTTLTAAVGTSETQIAVAAPAGFVANEIIRIGGERMKVLSVTANTIRVERGFDGTKVADHEAESLVIDTTATITVERGVEGTEARGHKVKKEIAEVGEIITVERGVLDTDASEHEAGAEVLQGPITPPDTVTSGTCGQKAVQEDEGTPAETVQVSGSGAVSMGDNFFEIDGKRNPTIAVRAGSSTTLNLTNSGTAPHNLVIAGNDDEFASDDDIISNPDLINGGGKGTVTFNFTVAKTYLYQCDFHPNDMKGEISVSP